MRSQREGDGQPSKGLSLEIKRTTYEARESDFLKPGTKHAQRVSMRKHTGVEDRGGLSDSIMRNLGEPCGSTGVVTFNEFKRRRRKEDRMAVGSTGSRGVTGAMSGEG